MSHEKHHMDLSFLKSYDPMAHYKVFDVVATSKCKPMMVLVSKGFEPKSWCIAGNLFSVHFLRYSDMEDYMRKHNMEKWTERHERISGIHMSIHKRQIT